MNESTEDAIWYVLSRIIVITIVLFVCGLVSRGDYSADAISDRMATAAVQSALCYGMYFLAKIEYRSYIEDKNNADI